jgi:hypothetical protein
MRNMSLAVMEPDDKIDYMRARNPEALERVMSEVMMERLESKTHLMSPDEILQSLDLPKAHMSQVETSLPIAFNMFAS